MTPVKIPPSETLQELLGRRLTPLPHFQQIHKHYLLSDVQFIIVPAGRRSYKTEIAKRKIIKEFTDPLNVGNSYFVGAPTREQVKGIYWMELKAMIPPLMMTSGLIKINESHLTITLKWSKDPVDWTTIGLYSMEKPERIEGKLWHGGIIDEIADCKLSAWTDHIYPALADTKAWVILVGVPEGPKFYREAIARCKYVYEQTTPEKMTIKHNPDGSDKWVCYTWYSSLTVDPEVLAEMRANMDERTYQQEMEGKVLSFEGALYYTHSKVNVDDTIAKIDPSKPLYISADFNKAPMVWEVAQEFEITFKQKKYNAIKFVNEIAIAFHAKTPACIHKFIQEYRGHPTKVVYITGDSSGKHEGHMDHTTDYITMKEALIKAGWQVILSVPKVNPSVNNRTNIVCSLLESSAGAHRLFFNKKCKYAIKDMERVETDGKGDKDKKSDKTLTHASDCIDYIIWRQFSKEFYNVRIGQI